MKKINIKEFIYTLGYTLLIIPNFFSKVIPFENLLKPIMYSGIVILALLFIIKYLSEEKIAVKLFLRLIALFLLCILSSIKSGTNDMLKLYLIIVSFTYKDFEKFLKKDVIIKIILISIVILFYSLGLTENQMFMREEKVRYAFGFSQPNQLALFLTMVGIEILYIYKDKKKNIVPVAIMLIFLLVTYRYADSRSSVLLIIFAIITFICRNKIKTTASTKRIMEFLTENMFIIMTVFSLIAAILYTTNNGFITVLNTMFSSRIKWASVYYNYYGINLLGHDLFIPYNFVKKDNTLFYCLDNGYLYFILHFGAFFWLLYAYMFNGLLKKCIKEKNHYLVMIIIGLLIYGLMENTILKYAYNPFLTLFGAQLYHKKIRRQHEKI